MKKELSHDSLMLPILPQSKVQRGIKDILRDLKVRKMLIEQRIKSQDKIQKNQIHQSQPKKISSLPFYMCPKNSYKPKVHTEHASSLKDSASNVYETFQETIDKESTNMPIIPNLLTVPNMPSVSNLLTVPNLPTVPNLSTRHNILNMPTAQNKETEERDSPVVKPICAKQKSNQKIVKIKEWNSAKMRKQAAKQIQSIVTQIPPQTKDRTVESIQVLKQYLIKNNMFFGKLQNILTTCLLKLNRFIWFHKNEQIYKIGEEKQSFFIILCGKIKINNRQSNTKKIYKICYPGETVGEQLIFMDNPKLIINESCKAMSKCLCIEIKIYNYNKLREEMIKFGYKLSFYDMEGIIKRNFITKNYLRNQFKCRN